MPFLKRLDMGWCHIDYDGFVVLVSTLEQNTSLEMLSLEENEFGERGFMALAESLPNIKGLQQIAITANASFQSTLPLLLDGFRKNTSLMEVNIYLAMRAHTGEWSQELKFLGQRNRFTLMLKAWDPPDASPQLGIWCRALAKVATEPDVLFHALRNKPKLVGSTGDSKKRERNDEYRIVLVWTASVVPLPKKHARKWKCRDTCKQDSVVPSNDVEKVTRSCY